MIDSNSTPSGESSEGTSTEFSEEGEAPIEKAQVDRFREAVLYSSDWTVETVISQIVKQSIDLNPHFQRRDAWSRKRKSQFIESIILGLPIPQIVLAEQREQRGKYIVLDGKQRLLSLLQFVGEAPYTENNRFALTGLEVRTDLNKLRFSNIYGDPALQSDLYNFWSHTIRAVLIRNWPSTSFLHTVFLRLNTGTVKLSPQELRQAMFPGPFSDFVDDAAASSEALRLILGQTGPDPRMRDVELLVRYLGFQNFIETYSGRMKEFLDQTCRVLNQNWEESEGIVKSQVQNFDYATIALVGIFGTSGIARRNESRYFNRAIFDALIFYASNPQVLREIVDKPDAVRAAYFAAMANVQFLEASESDTAGLQNTFTRFRIWGEILRNHIGIDIPLPEELDRRIVFRMQA